MMTKQEALAARLSQFNQTAGVRGSAIVTRDGLPLISSLPHGINPETFAAMVATAVGAAETAASEVDPSAASRLHVAFERIGIIATDAGPELIVVAITNRGAEEPPIDEGLDGLARDVRDIV